MIAMQTDKKPRKKRDVPEVPEGGALELRYNLAELPSTQHRAGLAGLVLMGQWLELLPERRGVFELNDLSDSGVTLRLDEAGLSFVFDRLYAAEEIWQESAQIRKRGGETDPRGREEEREITDEKGKVKKKKVYLYPRTLPKGELLVSLDPQRHKDSLWMKLWRDMIWSILRGVPATRAPFDDRAAGRPTSDAADTWNHLLRPPEHPVDLPSTYYLGAQATTAENVPFRDRARHQLLLHFWPYVSPIYVPAVLSSPLDNRREFVGYALAIPDVARLRSFCEELRRVLQSRSADKDGYLPKESVVSLALESALHLASRLQERIERREGSRDTYDLVLGYEVIHVKKEGNNVRMLSAARIEPEPEMLNQYRQCQDLHDLVFRHQVLVNLLARRPWFRGFDERARTLSYKKHFIGSDWFRRDALRMFEISKGEVDMQDGEMKADDTGASPEMEGLIYKVVQSYVWSKLNSKYGLTWDRAKMKEDSPERRGFNEKKEKIAKEAFLAVRSRTGKDFVDYFSSTIFSVKQSLKREEFVLLASRLKAESDIADVRTLTLLALSVHG